MADPYDSVKAGRLTFKGGSSIDKKKKKKKKKIKPKQQQQQEEEEEEEEDKVVENIYTIDAAKKMNYQELFPVEAKKFGYVPNDNNTNKPMAMANDSTVEAALDDRVKKKADRYCK